MKHFGIGVVAMMLATPAVAQTTSGSFDFVIPWDDAAPTFTDVSALNPTAIAESRRITINNGKFVDGTGARVRFLGGNFSFGANFPTNAEAVKIAAHLRKLGFNLIRLHHMDNTRAPEGIFDDDPAKANSTRFLDPENLDRLDFLVAELKKNGIYVDLNLKVSRTFTANDLNITDPVLINQLAALPKHKVLSWFDARMIELQKEYATQLLSHVNPYTGQSYANDPAVTIIEVINEDSLLGAAQDNKLSTLPPHYLKNLQDRWNYWLRDKYGSTSGMLAAWNDGTTVGNNLIANSDFKSGTTSWYLEKTSTAAATFATEPTADPALNAAKVTVTGIGNVQLHPFSWSLEPGTYTISFEAKSSAPRTMRVTSGLNQAPWTNTGLDRTVNLEAGTSYKKFNVVFTLSKTNPNVTTETNRLSFILGNVADTVWLRNVSFRKGANYSVEDSSQSIENNTYPIPPIHAVFKPGRDLTSYLMDVEQNYTTTMRNHIKTTLGAKGALTFSQACYGGLGGMVREAGASDFADMHAYYDHPEFPGGSWSTTDWTIKNTAMAENANGGTLSTLAMHRVAGKPFTVSEYNHTFPNEYQAEGLPMVAAFAAMQDWDGVFIFDYHSNAGGWSTPDIGRAFFAIDSNPAKLAFLPAMARMFRRGDVTPASSTLSLDVPSSIKRTVARGSVAVREKAAVDLWSSLGINRTDTINSKFQVNFEGSGTTVGVTGSNASSYQQINWDRTKGLFLINAPKSKGIIGFVGRSTTPIVVGSTDAFQFTKVAGTPNFLTMTLNTVGAGNTTKEATALMLTICGKVQNPGLTWNADKTSVSDWGSGLPAAEEIAGQISINSDLTTVEVWALDGTGARKTKITNATVSNGKVTFTISPQDKTLWYEIRGSKGTSAPLNAASTKLN